MRTGRQREEARRCRETAPGGSEGDPQARLLGGRGRMPPPTTGMSPPRPSRLQSSQPRAPSLPSTSPGDSASPSSAAQRLPVRFATPPGGLLCTGGQSGQRAPVSPTLPLPPLGPGPTRLTFPRAAKLPLAGVPDRKEAVSLIQNDTDLFFLSFSLRLNYRVRLRNGSLSCCGAE